MMNSSKRSNLPWKWSAFLLTSGVLLFLAGIYPFLRENEPIEAEILVVEGWLPEYALEEALKEFRSHPYRLLVTTGVSLPQELPLNGNGSLIFSPSLPVQEQSPATSTIRIEADGTPLKGIYPHFTLSVNDSTIGSQYVTGELKQYSFPLRATTHEVRAVTVSYDNDAVKGTEDRNLYVTAVWLNQHRIDTARTHVTHCYNQNGIQVKEVASRTFAEQAARTLRRIGLDSALVMPIPVTYAPLGRTYTSALACREWLLQHHPEVKSVNVFSLGIHTRRSHYLYRKAFGDQVKVGIISVPDRNVKATNWWTNKETIHLVSVELAKYGYARFFQREEDSETTVQTNR